MKTLNLLRSGKLNGAKTLKIQCQLQDFPEEIFDLSESLEVLDLSGNQLTSLPDSLIRLKKLRVLFCSNNQFTELPEILGQFEQLSMVGFKANAIQRVSGRALPKALRWLILTDNQIQEIPAEIGHCVQLQKLMLAGNLLQTLPFEIEACKSLELLRISANQFSHFPEVLLSLPRLSWLAYSGNPFCTLKEAHSLDLSPHIEIHWGKLWINNKLGEGASGVIYRANLMSDDGDKAVAVKLFKGQVTSDGYPLSEMATCLGAGTHPNLIPIMGCVEGHPEQASALVMNLIDPSYHALAGPPSLESCTRDIYDSTTRFEIKTVMQMALCIASVCCHLHNQGISHGDLYAHNIMHCGDGALFLGDFGAASFLPVQDVLATQKLQKIEVRAFACLLEELLAVCDHSETDQCLILLNSLKDECMQSDLNERPLFKAIEKRLLDIQFTIDHLTL
jgi:Protein tyrosine and serine/threonine kinase/Leucine Rich repeats (2 copies)